MYEVSNIRADLGILSVEGLNTYTCILLGTLDVQFIFESHLYFTLNIR